MPEVGPEIAKRKIAQGPEVEKECGEIDVALAELKAAYEQYFLGLDRQPPSDKHRALKRRITQLKTSFVQQTSLKFRVGNLYQKFLTYERLWDRTLKEMEAGTYHRDIYKARRRAHGEQVKRPDAKGAAKPAADDFDVDEDVGDLPPATAPKAPAPASPPRAVNGKPTSAPARPQLDASALSDDKVRAIFNAYVSAKKRCNEDVSKLSFDAVAQNLRKQVPELIKQHKAKAIEFKIVIKDGKAVLKAVPKT
jgi:hypothetical protein